MKWDYGEGDRVQTNKTTCKLPASQVDNLFSDSWAQITREINLPGMLPLTM